MSTLCVYENYLRDRYVIGNPVHYAAGSSSPKPKSYDREGNEYTWSDEAGDYVRQVGGPGGGRTIRLSEVEKAEIEQPQSEQVDADSGQHGSNVVSAVDEKPKRRPANKKKEPQRKIAFDENASYEELVQKHYPDGKQVDFDDLGYTPSWRHRGVITLPDITLAIESNNLTFFDNVLSPTRFDDYDVVVLQDPDGNKRRLTSFELFELIRERLEDNNPEEPYRQEENDVDDALYGYKWVKLPRELRRAVDKRDKTRQVNRDVSEAIVVLNDFQEQIGNIAKYDEIPGDLLTGLVDCYLGIEKTAPHHDEGVGPKKIFLSRVHNFLAGASLARFLADNEDSPARGAAVRFVEDFLEAALSKTPKRKFNAIYDKAKEFGFSPHSVVEVYNSVFYPADYRATKPSESGESQVHSNTKPDITDETTKEPKESEAQFDDSGLGLPGKSNVALKPSVTENKDAAYFIRRDLDKVPEDVDKTGVSVSPKEVDDSPFDKTSATSKTSGKKRRGRTEEAFPELPPLNGDLQDIAVADEIRRRIHNWAIYTSYFDNKYIPGGYYIDGGRRLYEDEVYRRLFDKKTDARFWIDNEKDILNVLKKELDSGLAELANEGWKPSPEQAELTDLRYIEGEKFRDTARDNPNKYRSRSSAKFDTASNIRKYADKSLSARNRDEAIQIAKKLSSLAYYSATQGDEESTKICKDVVDRLSARFGKGDYGQLAGRQRVTDNHYQRAVKNASKKRSKEERANTPVEAVTKRTRRKASTPKEYVKKPGVSNSSIPEQQPEPVAETVQEQPAKPRPERWTPLKSKMNDDDKRVVENTRKRLNYGLSELAWRLGNAKERGDVQRVKQLVATAANHYLEQARRAYRSHGGTEALAAFDEALGGDGLTVGQLRDRVVDKFRKIAQMETNDLFKFAGERLDDFESFVETDREPIANKKIYLNSIRDKNGKWEDLDNKDSEIVVEDGKPSTLFPDEHFGRRMGSERGLADAVRRALKSMTRKGEYRDSFENGAEYADPKYNIDTPTRMGRFLAHGYKDSLDGKPVSRDDYSEQRYQELLEKFPSDRESRKLNNLFKSNNREVNKLIKENEDEYKKSKNKSEVVQRVVDGIRDILLERRQNGSAEAPPSESLRNGTAGEVLETGGADRLSDGGDGRNLASVIAEETKKSDIPESRVREELDVPRQSKTSLDSRKAVQSLRNLIQRVYDHDGLSERIKSRAANVFGDTLSAPGETGFEPIGEHDKHLFELVNKLDKAKKRLEEIQERFDENPDSEKLERAVDKAEDVANGIEDRLIKAVDKFIQPYSGKPKSKRPAPVAKKQPLLSTRTPQKEDKTDWEKDLELQEELKPVSKGKFNPDVEPYSYTPERNAFSSAGSVTPRYHRDKEIANTIQKWIDEQRKTGRSTDIIPYKEIFYPGESQNKPGRPAKQPAGTNAKVVEEIEAFDRVRSPEASSLHEKKKTADGFKKASSKKKRGEL